MKNFLTSWSGGKDSCYALMKAQEQGFAPTVLLNMLNENGVIIRSHAIPRPILEKTELETIMKIIFSNEKQEKRNRCRST
ncbi:MAG: hypothetical protein KA713_19650 [Chryseotalea sp. WA131a]|nr:MAG: hypothetical protein KA713_19650 [Chryseotalea sp. WA131a]